MTKQRKSLFTKVLSIYLALTLTLSHLSPFFLFATQVQAAQADTTQESLQQPDKVSFNPETHSLEVNFTQQNTETNYALYYEHDEVLDAAVGQTSSDTASIFVGTQSGESSNEVFPDRAILKVQTQDSNVVFASQLELEYPDEQATVEVPFVSYEGSDMALTSSETLWLSQGVHRVDSVDTNETYEYPLNKLVSVTFTQLPEDGGSLRMAEVQLSDEQVEELGTASATAYEITSSMENGTFEYDLTLPNPVEGGEVSVQYSEDGENFEQAAGDELVTEEKDGNNVVRITGLDHFTVFVVTESGTEPDCDVYNPANTGCYADIQTAVNTASDGHEIQVANGTYVLSSTLNVNKEVTITGQSEAGVTIDATSLGTSYGIAVRADNVTLEKFTLLPPLVPALIGTSNGGAFPIHVSNTPNTISDLTLSQITIEDSNRTAFDLNGVDGATLTDLTARNSRAGNGLSLSGSSNVVVENFTSEDNAWGGIALYNSTYTNPDRSSDNVTLKGDTFSISEPNQIYVQNSPVLADPIFQNLTVEGFDYIVKNDVFRAGAEHYTFYQNDKDQALDYAVALHSGPVANTNSTVMELSTGDYFVSPGMEIQRAIEAAEVGATIFVAPGTYTENLVILKDGITLQSTDGADVTVIDANGATNGIEIGEYNKDGIHPEGVTIDGFTVTGWAERGIGQRNGNGKDLKITNNILIGPANGARNAISISGGDNIEISNNDITTSSFDQENWSGTGILLMGGKNVLVQNNTISGADLCIAIGGYPAWSNLDPNWVSANGNILKDNTVSDCETGIALDGEVSNTEITGNTITGNDTGVAQYVSFSGTPADNVVQYNKIFDNITFGVRNTDSLALLTADLNWWGSKSGPSGEFSGSGDAVTENTSYVEFLCDQNSNDWTSQSGSCVDPIVPVQTGYNYNDGSSFATPRDPNMIACLDGATNVNGISVHWTSSETGDSSTDGLLMYRRQFKAGAGGWSGSEVYSNPYTNYRSFGGGGGIENTYGSRVQAFYDLNGNGMLDAGEPASDFSNECYITFDNTNPIIEYIQPTSGQYYSGDVNIEVEVTEDNPHQYQFRIRGMVDGTPTGQFYSTGWVTVDETFDGTFNHIWDSTTAPYGDGQYRLDFDFRDKAGNQVKKNLIFYVDNGKPTIPQDLTVIPTSPTNQTSQTWSWSPSTDIGGSGIFRYFYQVLGASSEVITSGYTTATSVTTSLLNGLYSFFVQAEDNVGNMSDNAELVDYLVDTVHPVTQITSPIANQVISGKHIFTGESTDADPSSGMKNVIMRIGTQADNTNMYTTVLGLNTETGEWSHEVDTKAEGIPDGYYNVRARTQDNAGNNGIPGMHVLRDFIIDNSGPEISDVTMLVNGSASTLAKPGDTIRISARIVDEYLDVDRTRIIFRQTPNTADTILSPNQAMVQDAVDPDLYHFELVVPATYTSGTELNQAVNGNFFRIRAWDDNNNRGMTGQNRFTIDSILPQSSITGPGEVDPNDQTTIIVSDWDGSVIGEASDTAPGQVAGVELEISRTIATVTTYWDGSEWSSDADSRVQAESTDGFANWNYQMPAPASDELTSGTYTVTSRAYDTAGNKENSAKLIIVLDREIPEVAISVNPTNPDGQNNWYETRPTVTLTSTGTLSGLKEIQYSWNNPTGPWTTYTSPFQIPAQGSYVLYYRAINNADVPSETGIKNLRWDETTLTQGPINVSANPSRTSGSTSTISWDAATDNIGIDRYEIIWKLKNGGPEYSKSVSSSTRETEIDRMTEEGEWEVFVRAYDPVGNMKDGATLVTVDRTAPAAPTLELAGTAIGSANLTWNAVENASRYIVYYGVNPGEYIFAASVGNTTAFTVEGLAADTYYFMVRAVDDVDNQSSNSNEVTTGAIAGAPGTTPGTGGTAPAAGFDDAGEVLGDEDDAEADAVEFDEDGNPINRDGEVAGATDENCGTMQQYFPWILLAVLTLGAVAIELVLKRHTGLAKMGIVISLLVAVIGTHYLFNNPDCFVTGSITNIVNNWFIGLAVVIAALARLAGYAFVEEVEI